MTVYFSGYVFQDDGDALSGATVQLLQVSDGAEEASTTTDSNGLWAFNEADDDRYDVKITSGTSVRYRKWADEISLKTLDVRNNEGNTVGAASFTNLTNNASNQVATFSGANSTRADGDEIYLSFKLANSAGDLEEFARITTEANDVTDGEEDGEIRFSVMKSGTLTDVWTLDSSTTGSVSMDINADSLTLGAAGDTDITLTFDANTGDGVITWMEDEDYFKFSDEILMNGTEKLLFGDTGTFIHQSSDGVLTIESDTTVDINGAVVFNGALSGISTIGASGVVTAGGFTIGSAAIVEAELETIDGVTAGTAAASKAVVLDGSKNIATIGTIGSGAITSTGTSSFGSGTTIGNLTLANGSITDSGGALDFGNETLTTTGSVDFGAATVDSLSVSDANITNVADIALDSISADGTDINVAVSDNSATALTIKQGSDAYLIVDTANSSESVAIGTGISGTAISIGHSTSETTINDNLTVTGTGDIGGGAIDGTAIGAASASTIVGTTIDATTDFTIGDTVITDGVVTDTSGLALAANVTVTGNVLPNADDTYDLGSASAAWQDLFLEGDITLTDAGTIATSAGDLTLNPAGDVRVSDLLSIDGSTGNYLALTRTSGTITDGQTLGTILFRGDDPSASQNGAQIVALADGTWSSGAYATEMLFKIHNGSTTITPITIASDGDLTFAGDVTITGTTPRLTIGDGGAEDTMIRFDGNEGDWYVALDDSNNSFMIGEGSTVGSDYRYRISDSGDYNYAHYMYHSFTSNGGGTTAVGLAVGVTLTGHADDSAFLAHMAVGEDIGGANITVNGNVTNVTTLHLSEPEININSGTVTNASTLYIANGPGEGANDYAIFVDSANTNRFDGAVTCLSLTETSDITAKENIATIDTAIDTVKRLRPVTFDWKEHKKESAGFIAQEVEKVIPYLVEGTGNEYKSIKSFGILAQVTKALQESIDKIEVLEKKVEELQGA